MSICLLAASLNFQLYWRALPSFPVLANSGKLWLAQKLKVCLIKHPQGFREGGVRGGRERVLLRGRPPWPLGAHFAQKGSQSRSHGLPLSKKLQKDAKKWLQGCHMGRFIEILTKNDTPKWSKMQYSHHKIAIFTSCPKSPKWCHMVPKGLQNESLGLPKCSKVEPSGPPRVPRGAQSAPKCAKRSPLETPWNASCAQSGPSALQGSIFEFMLNDFCVYFVGCLV